jgi:hypothetical protein
MELAMPKHSIPTAARVREILHYSPDTGEFWWIQPRLGCRIYIQAGSTHKSRHGRYRRLTLDGKGYGAHLIAWLYMKGRWCREGMEIHHKNLNSLDNKWNNLEEVIPLHNKWARKRKPQFASKYGTGVQKTAEGHYVAIIQRRFLGSYNTAEEAAEAYRRAAIKAYGKYSVVEPKGTATRRRIRGEIPYQIRINGKLTVRNSSGFTGVGKFQGKWRARYKDKHVGSGFDTPEEAYEARLNYIARVKGEQ